MKLRLLKELPGYPKSTVFDPSGNEWSWEYQKERARVQADWLVELLNAQFPTIGDDYADFFDYIQDESDLYYVANVDGTVTTYSSYSFWDIEHKINAFKDKATAENKARAMRDVLLSDQGKDT